jgi:hypothetical protein
MMIAVMKITNKATNQHQHQKENSMKSTRWTKQMRKEHFYKVLSSFGFSHDETSQLLRVEKGLSRWHELECGTGNDKRSESVERDEVTGKPFRRIQWRDHNGNWRENKHPTPDREKGLHKQLVCLFEGKAVRPYIQGDCRGCAVYIIRPNDIPEGESVDSFYSRGIPVCF